MKTWQHSWTQHALWLLLGWVVGMTGCSEQGQRPVAVDAFGPVVLYQPATAPKGLVVFFSDASGWNEALVPLGGALASRDYLVAGVDSRYYWRSLQRDRRACIPLGLDLQQLASSVQQQHGMPRTQAPIVVGIGQGAVLAYVAAAQLPEPHFHAVISIDFCPTWTLPRPLCPAADAAIVKAGETPRLVAVPHLGTPWFVFQNRQYQGCSMEAVSIFVKDVANARLTLVPSQPDRDGAAQADWQAQFLALMQWLDPRLPRQAQSSATLRGLPLIEGPVVGDNEYLAVLLSGDGGWAALDKGLADELEHRGVSTVGWDSLSYFWQPRTPEQVAADMQRLLRHYLAAWNKRRVILIGYSFGADALPFIVNRLPVDLRTQIAVVALLGLNAHASFAFHLTQWLGLDPADHYPVAPELPSLQPLRVLCVFGAEETDSLCPALAAPIVVQRVPGDHHFNHDYRRLADAVVALLPTALRAGEEK